jgi:hypothetical protein
MCDPFTIAAMTIASGAISAGGALYGGFAQANMHSANAKYAKQQADHARLRGDQAAMIERLKGSRQAGQATVGLGASGIELTSGSALDIVGDIAMMTEFNAQQSLVDHENQARGFEFEAAKYKSQAKTSKIQGVLNATSTVLGTAGKVAGGKFPNFFGSSGSDPWAATVKYGDPWAATVKRAPSGWNHNWDAVR